MSKNSDNKQYLEHNFKNEPRMLVKESVAHYEPFELEAENEFRLSVGENSDVKLKLSIGLAEIHGSQMQLYKEYSLPPHSSISIFTWHGCVIEISGKPEVAYVVNDTAFILNVVIHSILEERRVQAEAENKKGPTLLVVGPNDVNRNGLCHLVLNYAVHLGRQPLYIDLDVGQNLISLPSNIGILTVEKPSDIVTGFDNQAVQSYHFGYRSPWENMRFYFLLVQRLGLNLQSRLRQTNQNVRTSGVIINGCDWSKCEIVHHGYEAITLVAMSFEIDILCVLEEESLYLQLQKAMPSSVKVIFIPKLINGVERNRYVKSYSREARIRQYFYGPPNQLKSYTFEVKYSSIKVFKVSARAVKRYTHFLTDTNPDDAQLVPVLLNTKLVDQILGLSCADDLEEDLMFLPVIGFICITNVDMVSNVITVLSPHPGPLPKKILIMGNTRLKKCQ